MKNRPQRQAAARSLAKCKAEAVEEDELTFTEYEEESQEYNQAPEKKSKGRSSKRQKKEQPAPDGETNSAFETLPTIGRSKVQGRLSLLPTMPLDILVAVFSFLQPKDILSLARTTRTFRDVLMSRQATTVWKTAREGIGAPECPSIISEPHWATLLSGHICQTCGTTNVHYVLYTLLRRACKACTSSHLLSPKKLEKYYPRIDDIILELIPYLIKGGAKHFWDDDVEMMSDKVAAFKTGIRKHAPGAQAAFDEFERVRKAAIGELAQLGEKCRAFIYKDRIAQMWEEQDIGRQRLQMIKARFQELGYEDDDLEVLDYNYMCTKRVELTDHAWKSVRKGAEPELIYGRQTRLEKAHAALRQSRRRLIAERFDAYQKTIPPSQWKYLPRTLDISFLESFSKLVLADETTEVTATSFDDAFKALPDLLEKADTELKDALRDSLPGGKKLNRKGKGRASSSTTPDPVDLAHSVFECDRIARHRNWLFGWDDIPSHHCLDENSGLHDVPDTFDYKRTFCYKPNAVPFADQVIELAGLDPATALARDMDQLDLRFAYYYDSDRARVGAEGYRWRTMIEHLTDSEKSRSHQRNVNVYLLSDDKTKEMKAQERVHSVRGDPFWICGHCPEYNLQSRTYKTSVEAHVKEKHCIANPKPGTDILFFTRVAPTFVHPKLRVMADSPTPAEESDPESFEELFVCLRCADARNYHIRAKPFSVENVRKHLLVKHQVPSPKEGLDYRLKSEDD